MSNSFNQLSTLPNMTSLAIIITKSAFPHPGGLRKLSDPSTEPDGYFNVVTWDFPRIVKRQPIIWEFRLISIDDLLFEDSIIVTDSIAHRGDCQSRKRIKVTSCKSTQTSVSQCRIWLLFENIFHICRAQFLETLCNVTTGPSTDGLPVARFFMPMLSIALSKVRPIRNSNDRSTSAPFFGVENTINSFRVLCGIRLMSFIPRNKQSISHCQRRPMVRCKIIKIVHTPRQGCADVSHNLPLKLLFCLELVECKGLPQATCLGRDTRCQDFDFFLPVASGGAGMVTRTYGHASLRESVDTHEGSDSAVDVKIEDTQGICSQLMSRSEKISRPISEQTRALGDG